MYTVVEIETTPAQEAAMRRYLNNILRSKGAKYNLPTENCVQAVDDILESGGVKTPTWSRWRTPNSYLENLIDLTK